MLDKKEQRVTNNEYRATSILNVQLSFNSLAPFFSNKLQGLDLIITAAFPT